MKILIVDDHAVFRASLKTLLEARKVDVVGQARDGLEALEQARLLHPDLILMDIQMPRCDGLAATRLIKAELPEIKIVMLTMAEDDANLFEAIKSGATGYLFKRASLDEFLAVFADIAEGSAPFSPGLAPKVLAEFARLANQTEFKPKPVAESALSDLTERQIQVLTLVAQGKTYREVSDELAMGERTVKYHMNEIINRLHMNNRTEVIAYVARVGLGGKKLG